ncbi:MFS general substrate transporter [Aulographum hederae CBS 113979]|uniref:MFS general substrate transporter n=1 Tax=Aulographum hederae CBS 113979 TaxID=1176131 RepID=A0A6G1GME9_9PEZI|nr:MFS general substrate transporter [Aulographum hederae CBS 113979]
MANPAIAGGETASGNGEQEPLLQDAQASDEYGAVGDGNGDATNGDDDQVPLAEEATTKQAILILGTVWIGVFFAALDGTIVATLAGPISTSFNSFTLLSWIASAYLIANAALQPLSGRLTDIFGRRSGLIFSNIMFAAGNLICGLAKTDVVMIFGRVVSGMGGGGLNTISTFIASDLIPLRRRGLWQGFGNICFALGAGLGGVFGGWVNDASPIGWRMAFLVQVPFIVVSGIIVAFTVKIPVKEKSMSRIKRVDFLGSLTLIMSLVLLLLGLNSGGNIVPWTHPLVLASLPLSVVFLCAFVYVEKKVAAEPVIPVDLLLDRTVAAACLANWFSSMALFGLLYYGPIYFQVLGYSTTASGARLIPSSAGAAIGSLGSGFLMKVTGKYYILTAFLLCCMVAANIITTTLFNRNVAVWVPFISFFLNGLGYGGMLTTTLLSLISAVDHASQALVTSASYAFRSTGSTIGITVAGAVFQNLLKKQLWERFGDEPGAAGMIRRLRDDLSEIKNLPEEWRDDVLTAYIESLRGVWGVLLGLMGLALVSGLFMREHTLHSTLARK